MHRGAVIIIDAASILIYDKKMIVNLTLFRSCGKWLLLIGILCFIFAACNKDRSTERPAETPESAEPAEKPGIGLNETEQQYLEELRESGGFRVATMLYPGAYEIDNSGNESGMHCYLIRKFGEVFNLSINTEFVEFDDFFARNGSVPENVKNDPSVSYTPDIFGRADVIAFDLTAVDWRNRLMRIIPLYPYRVVVVNRRGEEVSHIGQLQKKRFVVYDNTAHEVFLQSVSDKLQLDLQMTLVPFPVDRLQMLIDKKSDYAIGDSQALQHFISDYPELNISFPLTEIEMNGWAVAKDNAVLEQIVEKFFRYAEESEILNEAVQEGMGISLNRYYKLVNADTPATPEFTEQEQQYLDKLKAGGGLTAAIFDGGSVYKEKDDGTFGGLHYYLALSIAHMLDIPIRFTPVGFNEFFEKEGVVPEQLKTDPGYSYTPDLLQDHHVYIGNISPLPWRKKFLSFINLFPTRLVYVVHKDTGTIENKNLHKYRFAFIPNSSYEAWLKKNSNYQLLNKIKAGEVEEVLELIQSKRADISIADANLVLGRLRAYPDISFYPADEKVESLSWAVSKDNILLQSILKKSIDHVKQNGLFGRIWEDYYGSTLGMYLEMLSATGQQ